MNLKFGTGLAICLLLGSTVASGAEARIDGTSGGRVFEGVGAVSAGASSRLLYDYPEPQRSQILDLLFKPRFGAGFQHLKVEIGGGENSTCGSEPSHAVTREELSKPKARGYEFWLMKEARRRNPGIILDCLPWSYPGWLKGKFTEDSAQWFVSFLDVARRQFGVKVDWISAAENENGTNRDWIVQTLKPALQRAGYKDVRIQAPDDDSAHWKIFEEFEKDTAYDKAVAATGYHYVSGREPWTVDIEGRGKSTEKAVASGKPLWASEEWSTGGGRWNPAGALYVAQLINKVYLRDRITKTELWAPVDSIYNGLPYEDTGVLRADSPWSGHFEIWPAAWAVAHTTQFARPGWVYVDSGCGRFRESSWQASYVTLRDPRSGDWSMIVTTGDRKETLTAAISGGLMAGRLAVWRSTEQEHFVEQPALTPSNGRFSIELEPKAIYTITTTGGQKKGMFQAPPERPFPLPFVETFEDYAEGATPRYFSDQKGTFEVARVPGGGKCLRQVTPESGHVWVYIRNMMKPLTLFGDKRWSDVTISADVRIEGGDVEIGGRFAVSDSPKAYQERDEMAYRFIVSANGEWWINYKKTVLATGVAARFKPGQWHRLALVFRGTRIQGLIDGSEVGAVDDVRARNGLVHLGTTYHGNLFDNVRVEETSR